MRAMDACPHIDAPATIKAKDTASWLLSHGITSVTTKEIADLIDVPINHVRQRMLPLMKRGEMISPARRLWIPVSPAYREWGGPEAIAYIDSLMRYFAYGSYSVCTDKKEKNNVRLTVDR